MATVMTSQQPPLPARNRTQPNTTHISYKPASKSDSFQQNVPYTQHTTGSNVTHVKLGHSSSMTDDHHQRAPPSGRRRSEPAAPPLPSRNQEPGNHPIRKRSFETNSFINRNTARIFSDPDKASRPPQPPPIESLQNVAHHRSHTTPASDYDAPPPLPESRPPRGRPKPTTPPDFESRFRFHDPSEFPEPDYAKTMYKKDYPSTSIKRRHHHHAKKHELTLDPL